MNGLDENEHVSDVKSDTFSNPTANCVTCVMGSALKPDEDEGGWIHLPSKPKQPLWKHLSEESFLSDLVSSHLTREHCLPNYQAKTPNQSVA